MSRCLFVQLPNYQIIKKNGYVKKSYIPIFYIAEFQ